MINVDELRKSYGRTTAVDGLTFRVEPGRVTGFLGPNGSGKSTTMRVILGLDTPDSGTATIGGVPYAALPDPLRTVGCLLDAHAVHGARTGRDHLRWLAQSNRIPKRRVDEVLERVGLSEAAARPVRQYSLGMAQRLGFAAALLGDPAILILDEPANGLDTDGIRWIRDVLRSMAVEGRTVLLSSHLLSEMELTADHLVVIGRGRLLADTPMTDFIERTSAPVTLVRAPDMTALADALRRRGHGVCSGVDGEWEIRGARRSEVGDLAASLGVTLHQLSTRRASLEEVYLRTTEEARDFRGARP